MRIALKFMAVTALSMALDPCALRAANSVVVESKTIVAGSVDVPIRVYVTNDVTVAYVDFPFELRTVSGGAFISSIRMQLADRLGALGWSSMTGRGLATPNGTQCKNSQPGGYKDVSWSGFNTDHAVAASPECVSVLGWRLFGGEPWLRPGADASGSIVLTVTVLGAQGEFEIDTTCVDPSSHLALGDSTGLITIVPNFTKGRITVVRLLVRNLDDSGPGSLREAISIANANSSGDTIVFAVSGVIHLLSPLPALSDAGGGTAIRGFTAPGASPPNTPSVILDGSGLPLGPGFLIQSSNNLVEGLAIRNFNGPGIAVAGPTSVANTISGCKLFGNAGPGIDLGNDGITLNDPGDVDTGPNTLLNYPVFDSVLETSPGVFSVYGRATPLSNVELFLAAQAGDPEHQPEGTKLGPAYQLLAWTMAAAGDGLFSFPTIILPEWSLVTATATDPSGNTSELALNKLLTPDPLRFTAYSEPLPPVRGRTSMPLTSPAMQVVVISPPDDIGHCDTIGPPPTWPNTFGTRATYDSVTDLNTGGLVDTRVKINSPDSGEYKIKFILIDNPGNYLTGIGIDGHAEVQSHVAFSIPGQIDSVTFLLSPVCRGELTGDGVTDVFDVIEAIDIVFGGKPLPDPPEKVDVNCDGLADVFDVIHLIDYTFSGGTQPCQ